MPVWLEQGKTERDDSYSASRAVTFESKVSEFDQSITTLFRPCQFAYARRVFASALVSSALIGGDEKYGVHFPNFCRNSVYGSGGVSVSRTCLQSNKWLGKLRDVTVNTDASTDNCDFFSYEISLCVFFYNRRAGIYYRGLVQPREEMKTILMIKEEFNL